MLTTACAFVCFFYVNVCVSPKLPLNVVNLNLVWRVFLCSFLGYRDLPAGSSEPLYCPRAFTVVFSVTLVLQHDEFYCYYVTKSENLRSKKCKPVV